MLLYLFLEQKSCMNKKVADETEMGVSLIESICFT